MRIYTLWDCNDPDTDSPWLVDSCDEYTVDDNNGFPEDYEKNLKVKGRKQLIIDVPEGVVKSLFDSPVVLATVVKT